MKQNTILWFIMLLLLAACHSNTEADLELIPVKAGDKFGYINSKGEYLINPQFEYATFFRGDRALVRSGDNYGYINKKGEFVINAIYSNATVFKEDIAWVVKPNGAPTAINTNGETLFIFKEADEVANFSEGLAKFTIADKSGYINKEGKIVIPAIYFSAKSFSEGLAAVSETHKSGYGFIGTDGKLVINYQFNYAKDFYKGKSIVSMGESGCGVIDKSGKYIITPQFSAMMINGDGYIIRLQGGEYLGYCDATGKIVINPQFQRCHSFGNSKLAVVKTNDKFGYIDETGKLAINPQFEYAYPFFGKYAFVVMNEKIGTIDQEGHYVINPQFSELSLDVHEVLSVPTDYGFSLHHVESEFFDTEYIAASIRKMITANSINGMNYTSNLKTIMEKYNRDEEDIDNSAYYQLLTSIDLCRDATLSLYMRGEFFDKTSDGWWGYNYALNKGTIPVAYQCVIQLKENGEDKEDLLFPLLLKAFGLTDNGTKTREARIGNYSLLLKKDYSISIEIVSGKEPENESN